MFVFLYTKNNHLWYNSSTVESVLKGGWLISRKGGDAMEIKDALILMFMFGMFILALLSYLKKK